MTTPRGGKRPGAGRPPRQEPKARPMWIGQRLTADERAFIVATLEPDERGRALLDAALVKVDIMNMKGEG